MSIGAMLRSAVLIVPRTKSPLGRAELVGSVNGMREATRALDCALALCANDAEIDLISVLPLSGSPTSRTPADDMCFRLQARQLRARHSLVRSAHASVASTLLGHAVASNADLIVLGGFGHSPIRESVFGGVTKEVIGNRHTTPILIVH